MPYADPEVAREYQRAYQREWARKRRAKKRAKEGPPRCKGCGEVRPPGGCLSCRRAYHRAYWHQNGDKYQYPERKKITNAAWSAANREHRSRYNTAYREANREVVNACSSRRRARKAEVQTIAFTVEQLAEKWIYWGNLCWICRQPATATDHVKPINKGGAHMLCNLRPICTPCNSSKSDRWPL